MSLIMKKRENEKQRMNGLNDPVMQMPKNTHSSITNEWTVASHEAPMTQTMHQAPLQPMTMEQLTSMPSYDSKSSSQFQSKEAPIKSLLQQSFLHLCQNEKKTKAMNGEVTTWTVPETPAMHYDMKESGEPVIIDGKLPPGAYYDPPTYIDPATGNPIIYQSQSPTTAITPADESNQAEQSSCNCSNCQNIMKTN